VDRLLNHFKRLYVLRHHQDFRAFFRYGVVGIAQNTFFYGAMLVLTHFNFAAWQAILLLYPLAIIISYLVNRLWSFEDRKLSRAQFFKYVSVYVIAYPCTVALAWMFGAVGLPSWLSTLFTLAIAIIAVFLALNIFVFGGKKRMT
jgi:putative flippase GtrA